MTDSRTGWRRQPGSAGRALALTLLLGAVGAAVAFLATRQSWAAVRTVPPRPLPASTVHVTGSSLVPYADAIVIAGLASLAAVIATRRVWRRISGLIVAALGIALAASVFTISSAAAVAAAEAAVGPASNPGAGSVTQGSVSASGVPDIADATPHVLLSASVWQAIVVLGALAMIAAGVIAAARPARLAVMSSRYDAPGGDTGGGRGTAATSPSRTAATSPAGTAATSPARTGTGYETASVWEALSRGEDPTTG
jgi:uncharacterized membrane protein (TIGR02234 family)